MASGNCSPGGIWIVVSLRPDSGAAAAAGSACGIVPVMSPGGAGCGVTIRGIGTGLLSGAPDAGGLNDCRPIGVGEVIDGIAGAGAGLAFSTGAATGGSDISVSGAGCCVALSSS